MESFLRLLCFLWRLLFIRLKTDLRLATSMSHSVPLRLDQQRPRAIRARRFDQFVALRERLVFITVVGNWSDLSTPVFYAACASGR